MEVIVDEQLIGWKNQHKEEFDTDYEKILTVGENEQLPKGVGDKQLATCCKMKDCALLTCDRKAHVDFFESGMETIHVRIRVE